MSFYELSALDNKQNTVDFSDYKGKVTLVVNTATKCGLTPQYEGLQKLYDTYKDQGFEVLDFPCNQFLNQAPGSAEDIEAFCTLNYNTSFKQFAKVKVNGRGTHPVFKYLRDKKKGIIKWNFTKFLVDTEGNVVKRYEPDALPETIAGDIESYLK